MPKQKSPSAAASSAPVAAAMATSAPLAGAPIAPSKPSGLGREGRKALLSAIDDKNWLAAVEWMENPAFLPADLIRKIARAQDAFEWWMDETLFSGCADNALIARAAEALVASHRASQKKSDPFPERLALFLVSEGVAPALDVALRAQPRSFSSEFLRRALSELTQHPRWKDADRAPDLKKRVEALTRWFPKFNAEQFFLNGLSRSVSWWSRRVAGQPQIGLGAVARLAAEAGLPMAISKTFSKVDARVNPEATPPLEQALGFPNPDVFFAFLQAGANPDAPFSRVLVDNSGKTQILTSFFGVDNQQFVLPERWATDGVMGQLSIRQIVGAAICAPLRDATFGTKLEVARERQAIWRAKWEEWTLRQAISDSALSDPALSRSDRGAIDNGDATLSQQGKNRSPRRV